MNVLVRWMGDWLVVQSLLELELRWGLQKVWWMVFLMELRTYSRRDVAKTIPRADSIALTKLLKDVPKFELLDWKLDLSLLLFPRWLPFPMEYLANW